MAKRHKREIPTQKNGVFTRITSSKVGGFFLNSKSVGVLVLKCLLLLLIPYAYLFLCGLVLDRWLKLTAKSPAVIPFIFYSLIVLYGIAIAVIVWAVVRFVRRKK